MTVVLADLTDKEVEILRFLDSQTKAVSAGDILTALNRKKVTLLSEFQATLTKLTERGLIVEGSGGFTNTTSGSAALDDGED